MLRFLKPNFGMAFFGARVLFAFFTSSLVLAHEAHHEPTEQAVAATIAERSFLEENEAAMTKMMNDMAAKPTGIDMAVIELRYGKNEQLRRIAQEIIVDQMQEIAAVKLAIGQQVSTSTTAPTQSLPSPATDNHHMDMHMDMSSGMKK